MRIPVHGVGDGVARTEQPPTSDVPGAGADRPTDVPRAGWWQIVRRAWTASKADQVPLLAAGVAFFAFLSLFPALVALVMVYGLVADPEQARRQVESFAGPLPAEARTLLTDQVDALTSSSQQSLGIGLVIALAVALWSASGGVGQLVTAVNTAYDEEETRGFVRRKALALLLTLGSIVVVVIALLLVAVLPALLKALGPPPVLGFAVQVLRWLLLVALVTVALAVVYRLAPDRDAPRLRWVSVGAVAATLLWVLASVGFSLYVTLFGSYSETYGALAGVVVLLLWLWITSYAVLLGAEANAEAEQQTGRDQAART